MEELLSQLEDDYNHLLSISGVLPEKAVVLYDTINSHIKLLDKKLVGDKDADMVSESTDNATKCITDFFSTVDKNNNEILFLLLDFRKIVGLTNVALINQFTLQGEEQMKTNNTNTNANNNTNTNNNDNASTGSEEKVNEARESLKDKLDNAQNEVKTCAGYWSYTNIGIATGVAVAIAAGAAYVGYRKGYSMGQDECPVIINVGSME